MASDDAGIPGQPSRSSNRARRPGGKASAAGARGRKLAVPVAVAAVGLASLGVVQMLPNRQAVQGQLADRSTRALSAAGIADARVQFDGRDATVHVRSVDDRDRALAIVRSQQGVRVARAVVDRTAAHTAPTNTRPTAPAASPRPSPATGGIGPSGRLPSGAASARSTTGPAPLSTSRASAAPAPTGPTPSAPGTTPPETTPPGTAAGPTAPGSTPPGSTAPQSAAPGSTPPPVGTNDALVRVQAALTELGPIRFTSASAALTPAGRRLVANVAAILRSDSSVSVEIQGFTDAVGPATTNLALSRSRARTVYDTLRVLGIPAARMAIVGYGESRAQAPNDSGAHRAVNRRVTFLVRPVADR
jgi:outer membrane protein OmpA-like peptidoglycan-associated protein